MVAFRFLYLGLLIGTALALPIYPRYEFDDVDITLREPSGDEFWERRAESAPQLSTYVNLLFPGGFVRLNAYFCLSGWYKYKPTCQSIFCYSIRAHGYLFLLIRVVEVLVHFFLFNSCAWKLTFACQGGTSRVVSPFFPMQFVPMHAHFCLTGWYKPTKPRCQSIFAIQFVPMDAYFCLSGCYKPSRPRCQSIFYYSIRAHGCLFLLVRVVHPRLQHLRLEKMR